MSSSLDFTLPVPTSDDGDSNLYTDAENDESKDVWRADKILSGTLRIADTLGPVSRQRDLLSIENRRRQQAIMQHTAFIESQFAEIEQIRNTMEPVSEEYENLEEEGKAVKLRDDLELLRDKASSSALDHLTSSFDAGLTREPGLLVRSRILPAAWGFPSLSDIEAALKAIQESDSQRQIINEKLVSLERTFGELKEEVSRRPSELGGEECVQSSESHHEATISTLMRLAGVEFGSLEEWPMKAIEDAMTMARSLKTQLVTRNASRWIRSIRLTEASSTGRSAREQALWLFSKVHRRKLEFSLADIYALAERMDDASLDAIHETLGFLHQFVVGLVRLMAEQGCSTNCAIIYLRSLELLLVHLSEGNPGYRVDAAGLHYSAPPSLQRVNNTSKLVLGMQGNIALLLSGITTVSLAGVLTQSFSPLRLGDRRLLSSGDDLIIVEGDVVYLIRSNKHRIEMGAMEGYRFVVADFPHVGEEWRSEWLELNDDNLKRLNKDFSLAMDRLKRMYEVWILDARLENFHIGHAD